METNEIEKLIKSEIEQALDRQHKLQQESNIALIKMQVVGEYRVKLMDLLNKIRAIPSTH